MDHDQNPEQETNDTSGIEQTEKQEDDFKYNNKQMDRDTASISQIKKLIWTFKGKLSILFPGKNSDCYF